MSPRLTRLEIMLLTNLAEDKIHGVEFPKDVSIEKLKVIVDKLDLQAGYAPVVDFDYGRAK